MRSEIPAIYQQTRRQDLRRIRGVEYNSCFDADFSLRTDFIENYSIRVLTISYVGIVNFIHGVLRSNLRRVFIESPHGFGTRLAAARSRRDDINIKNFVNVEGNRQAKGWYSFLGLWQKK